MESRLADHRRQKIVEALEATRQEEVEQSEDESDKPGDLDYKSADEKVRSAFKNLISKLKSNPLNFDQVNNYYLLFYCCRFLTCSQFFGWMPKGPGLVLSVINVIIL